MGLLFALGLLLVCPAVAQQSGLTIDVRKDMLGIGGLVQRGTWTPIRLDLTNRGSDNVVVDCRWILSDDDGDELVAQRPSITVQPESQTQRTTSVWLYANPPMSTQSNQKWVFQAVSTQTGELLVQREFELSESVAVEPHVNLIGVCGYKGVGLTPWQRWSTQHEPIRLASGLSLGTLPDRWYGMDALSALVWFAGDDGGEPTDSAMSESSKRALREWVYRGGHLVIVLPYAGQTWTSADSGLGDLIEPLKADAIKRDKARLPFSVFGRLKNSDPVPLCWFDLSDAKGYTALAEVKLTPPPVPTGETTAEGQPVVSQPAAVSVPVIVGRRFGFGQVTLVGIDLAEKSVANSLYDFDQHRVWTRIFSWRASNSGELIRPEVLDSTQAGSAYIEAKDARQIELGDWIGQRLSRLRATGPAVGLAFVLFAIYAIAAALTFPTLLRKKGWERHSWVVFTAVVALFSMVAWGGAWAMRPSRTTASHFTVLDIDGNSQFVRARSWQSLLIPSFTTADIDLSSDGEGLPLMDVVNLLSSPGHTLASESPGYPDRRTYSFDATQPTALSVPMRSTTKSLLIDYVGLITARRDGMSEPWTMPKASLQMNANGLPAGKITHYFPGPLTDVRIIFCPGGAQQIATANNGAAESRPLVYTYRNDAGESIWDPDSPLALPAAPGDYTPLWLRPKMKDGSRAWKEEGHLGLSTLQRGTNPGTGNGREVVKDIDLLSFYDAMPPPVYESKALLQRTSVYSRSMMRGLDLTPMITGRRIIIIGHLKDSPSPIPMTVDGDEVDSQGWTVVRWIYDL